MSENATIVEGDMVEERPGETPAASLPTIVQALAAVMEEVQSIRKTQENKQQNYNFRGIDTVVNAVGPALRRQHIIAVPMRAELAADERYETKSGANMRNVTVRIMWRFYGPAGDWIEASSLGEAADAGDKAVPKASSVAYRILLLQALCIPTDDPDPDASSHERAAPRRQEGPGTFPVPRSWADIERDVKRCDNAEEAWELFKAFTRAASYHLFGKTDSSELEQQQRDVLYQKAAGAVVWLHDNITYEMGELFFFDEDKQRLAWAHVLEGASLAIPDYVPPEPEAPEVDEEAERLAREALTGEPMPEKNESS